MLCGCGVGYDLCIILFYLEEGGYRVYDASQIREYIFMMMEMQVGRDPEVYNFSGTSFEAGDDLNMFDLLSFKFSWLYLSGNITGQCKLYKIQLTESSINMLEDIDAFINFIKSHFNESLVRFD